MPVMMCELSNETIIVLAEQGNHEASAERLAREIMKVDNVEWVEAQEKVKHIQEDNRKVLWVATMPYKIGIAASVTAGIGCIPLVFHHASASWFNKHYVTAELEEGIDTFYEVGSWSWGWMEPVLGTASFTLLALQFARAQMINMDLQPYTHMVREWRARRLTKLYPMYNDDILMDFARTSSMTPKYVRSIMNIKLKDMPGVRDPHGNRGFDEAHKK